MQELSSENTIETDHPFWKGTADPTGLKGPGVYAKLPSYGQAYLDQLIGEFKVLREICANHQARDLALEVVTRAEAGETMTWGDAYMLDTAIAQMLPEEYLHQRAWCLEVKYRDAVGNADAYDAFMKIEAPHLINEKIDHLRARVHNTIRELYRLYTVISCREDMREKLSREARKTLLWIFLITVCLVLSDLVTERVAMLKNWNFGFLDVWGVVFLAGGAGGLLSLQRRLQSLPSSGESLSDLVELSGRLTVKLTPIIGGTFAIVLFLVFSSGLLTGALFPASISKPTVSDSDFIHVVMNMQPGDTAGWGKLLVWSFIAGFAERFVPDTLDRLITRSEQKKQSSGKMTS
jgi:hypothetical protein